MKTFIVDSFTDRPFKGNPAGVCIIDAQLGDETMLHIAQELNLSETAFICPLDTSGTFSIRYFSPKMEIALCGHATLASGKAVFAAYGLGEIHFINIQNLDLAVRTSKDRVSMVFPVYDTHPAEAPPALWRHWGSRQSGIWI
jgi:PhzF family phenazine biosynthesis protein